MDENSASAHEAANAAAVTPAVPAPRRRRARVAIVASLSAIALLIVLMAALVSGAWWSVHDARGTAWLLSLLSSVQVESPKGSLLGDFQARRLVVRLPGGADTITIEGLEWRGLSIDRLPSTPSSWLPSSLSDLRLRITIDKLTASRVDIALAPSANASPPKAPENLRLPIELDVRALHVGELHASALGEQPLRAIDARVHLGANAGAEHRVEQLSLTWDRLQASGSAHVATSAPMALDASIDLPQQAAAALPAWNASAALAGPLTAPVLRATLRASPASGPSPSSDAAQRPSQSLDARATLHPFAAWPLGDLQASTTGLDLSAFASAAPSTALTGQAIATSTAADQPASVAIDLTNSRAGRWNDGRLPLRSIKLQLAARPDQPSVLELRAFEAELGTPTSDAGHISGSGRWSPQNWSLAATLKSLRPSLLDARAPAMPLTGPLTLAGDASAPGTVDVKADLAGVLVDRGPAHAGSARTAQPNAVRTNAVRTNTVRPKAVQANATQTNGTQRNSTQPNAVRLELDAALNPQRIEVRHLQATAGGARASITGLITHTSNDAPWIVKAKATLADFNPAVWWPGREDSPWRRAEHRLNAKADVELNVPASVADRPLLDAIAALRGQASLIIDKSLLAGVPLSGEATLRSTTGAQALATIKLDSEGNTLQAEGRLMTNPSATRVGASAPSGSGTSSAGANADAWDVEINASALRRLGPVFKLFQGADGDATLDGTLTASAHLSGRWPALSTQGHLDANALRIGALSVQRAQAKWTLGTSANAPVEAQATLTQATLVHAQGKKATNAAGASTQDSEPGPSLESLTLQLNGTGRAHTLELRAESKALPPAWTESIQAASSAAAGPSASRTVAVLQAQGGIVDLPSAALAGWRGTIKQLDVHTSSGAAAGTTASGDSKPGATLLRTSDVALEAFWGGGPMRAAIQPGRAEVLGGALRWSRASWQAAGQSGEFAQIEAEAQMEPLRIAPLLARAQPGFGWGGDLTISGHLKLRSAPSFSADIVIERSAGDLTVTDELDTRTLGLTDLRFGLSADNGVWNFTQGLAGKSVGVAAGAVVVRTTPQATWPTPDAPIQGVLELRVADLGTWGSWVPPGWRVEGALHSSASIGGRFGAPEYTGVVEGTRLAVRNFLQGVNVSDGDVSIRLQGSTARIDRFTAKAGSGSVKLEGDANFGDAPKAVLKLTADKFQLLGRVDRRIVTSGTGQLQLDSKTLAFDGKFNVDDGLIDFTRSDAPTLSDDVEVIRARGVQSPAAAASAAATAEAAAIAPKSAREVALDLRVGLGEKLRLRGRGLDTGLRGELHITSPGGRLAVDGTVRAVDGTYAAYGQKLSIDRGQIMFNGAVDNPRLDIEATRPNIDVRVGVAVSGTAANPRVRLFSEPELSEIDKLSWLVMGRASEGLGRTDTALLQRAALALLSGEGGGPTEQFTKALGLDDISVRQTDGEVRETVIALGKQLSRRWYVGYERGLNATTGSFQLIYRIAQRFTLRAQSGQDNSLDLIWTWRWH